MRCSAWILAFVASAFATTPATASQIRINEVLYDPVGTDGGHEFIELFNAAPHSIGLAGLELGFVNGADPARQRTVWRAPAALFLPPGAFFVVGESSVADADTTVSLGLQNGPDAIWLVSNGQPIDRLAYGDIEGLGEGSPADDASGTSLGRVPDGRDTDDNFADWRVLSQPTPGRPNAQLHHVRPVGLQTMPPWRPDAGLVEAEVWLRADGYAPLQTGRVYWWLNERPRAESIVEVSSTDEVRLKDSFWLAIGRNQLRVLVTSGTARDSVALDLQVGLGDVVLNELMIRPLSGQPEWLELHSRADAAISLEGWSVADATRESRALPSVTLPPRGFVVLVSSLQTWALDSAAAVVELSGAWPVLNNTRAADATFADEVLLISPSGVVADYLAYTEEQVGEAGQSLERGVLDPAANGVWFLAPGPPTPGRINLAAVTAPPDAGLQAQPNPFTPDGDGDDDVLHVLVRGDDSGATYDAQVFDLTGDRVRELGIDGGSGALRQWIWDGLDATGRPVPIGAYVIAVSAGGNGHPSRRWQALIALARRP